MTLKVNYLGKFLNSSSKNIAFFLKKETKISELAKIVGDKSISSTLNKLIKNENFTKKKIITSIDRNIDKKLIFIWTDKDLSSYEIENLGLQARLNNAKRQLALLRYENTLFNLL